MDMNEYILFILCLYQKINSHTLYSYFFKIVANQPHKYTAHPSN
jgi:hypothetical protein